MFLLPVNAMERRCGNIPWDADQSITSRARADGQQAPCFGTHLVHILFFFRNSPCWGMSAAFTVGESLRAGESIC